METWLDKIRQPMQVERLLEAMATRSRLMPTEAYRIRDPETLPPKLRQVLAQASRHVWVCFAHGSRIWLFTGGALMALSQQLDAPVLQVSCYNEEGLLTDTGAWTTGHEGKWHRWEG